MRLEGKVLTVPSSHEVGTSDASLDPDAETEAGGGAWADAAAEVDADVDAAGSVMQGTIAGYTRGSAWATPATCQKSRDGRPQAFSMWVACADAAKAAAEQRLHSTPLHCPSTAHNGCAAPLRADRRPVCRVRLFGLSEDVKGWEIW